MGGFSREYDAVDVHSFYRVFLLEVINLTVAIIYKIISPFYLNIF